MKKIFVVLMLILAASMAFADTAQLTLKSAPFQVNNNGAGPYLFNVQQSNPNFPSGNQFLVCWSDLNNININQSWTADVYTIATVPVTGPFNETADQYMEIAYLAQKLIANPGNLDLQIAVWYAAGLLKGSPTAGALSFYDEAYNAVVVAQTYAGGNALFYIAPGSSPGVGPQPLVGFVPEPGSLILLGSGILTAAGAIRRRIVG